MRKLRDNFDTTLDNLETILRQLGSPGKSQDPFRLSRLGRGFFHDTLSVAFRKRVNVCIKHKEFFSPTQKLDPVDSTVRYDMSHSQMLGKVEYGLPAKI